jgi:hypothetical protein
MLHPQYACKERSRREGGREGSAKASQSREGSHSIIAS